MKMERKNIEHDDPPKDEDEEDSPISLNPLVIANDEDEGEDVFDEGEELSTQEFSELNSQLDQLQSALDILESRNANIHEELLQLLQENREVREEILLEKSTSDGGEASTSLKDSTPNKDKNS